MAHLINFSVVHKQFRVVPINIESKTLETMKMFLTWNAMNVEETKACFENQTVFGKSQSKDNS